MGRSIEIAFLNEDESSAAIEVIQRLLDPQSAALPHITLRYAPSHRMAVWDRLDPELSSAGFVLEAPITFDGTDLENGISTLVLACSSDELEMHNYKPDFPSSILHITLYDGPPSGLVKAAFEEFLELPWGVQLDTALTVFSSSREAGAASRSVVKHGSLITVTAARFFERLLAESDFSPQTAFHELRDSDRLVLLKAAATHLHQGDGAQLAPARPRPDYVSSPREKYGQLEFWTAEELGARPRSSLKAQRKRYKRRSAVITPPELARDVAARIAEYIPDEEMVDFGDPAVGSGILYAAVRNALGGDRINSARVVEIDPFTAALVERRWARAGISVCEGDFLAVATERDTWSVLLANPPYLRSQSIQSDLEPLRATLQAELGLSVSARADLFVYFVLRAHSWLREDAVAAWILPAEFQVTGYGQALRTYLSSHVTLLHMHTYDASTPLFDNALASTSVIIYRKRRPLVSDEARVTFGHTMKAPAVEKIIDLNELSSLPRWSFQFLTQGCRSLENRVRIGDLFTLKRGIATGANDQMVLSEEQVLRMNVSPDWLRPLFPASRYLDSDHVSAGPDGAPLSRSPRWVINTDVPVNEIKARNRIFGEYLEQSLQMVRDRHLVSRRIHPFLQEDRQPPAFLFIYMAKADTPRQRFIRNDSNATYLNNYIGMYPRTHGDETQIPISDLHAALRMVPRVELEMKGRTYGKGLLKLEPKELAEVEVLLLK